MSSFFANLCFSYCFTWKLIFTVVIHVKLRFQFRSIQQSARQQQTKERDLCGTLSSHSNPCQSAKQPRQPTSTLSLAALQKPTCFHCSAFSSCTLSSSGTDDWLYLSFFTTWVGFSQLVFICNFTNHSISTWRHVFAASM